MGRPFKTNETPQASFNLRETGPLLLAELSRRLKGATYRAARGAHLDDRATVDRDPCPDCGALVEWAETGKRDKRGQIERYVYARCRGRARHSWSFRPQAHPSTADERPISARQGKSAVPLASWIDKRITELERELHLLRELSQQYSGHPPPSAPH